MFRRKSTVAILVSCTLGWLSGCGAVPLPDTAPSGKKSFPDVDAGGGVWGDATDDPLDTLIADGGSDSQYDAPANLDGEHIAKRHDGDERHEDDKHDDGDKHDDDEHHHGDKHHESDDGHNGSDIGDSADNDGASDSDGASGSGDDSDDGATDDDDAPPADSPPSTPPPVNPPAPADADGDGVPDTIDVCPNTLLNVAVNAVGCSCSQIDTDGDGVNDCDDLCPGTAAGVIVDAFGCAVTVADAGADVLLDEVGCVTLQGGASGGTPPYAFSWSAPGWVGSSVSTPTVVPVQTTVYTLTVTDSSNPTQTAVDTVTITVDPHVGLAYSIVDIGSLSSNSSFPAGINDSGDVVGFYFTDTMVKRAFLFSNGVMTDLGTLGGDGSNATAINNAGDVVGEAQTAGGVWHAFLWDAVNGMRDLGTLGGPSSVANAINDNGGIVGSSTTGVTTHAFFSDGVVMIDIDVLDSGFSEAYGVNDAGTAVGMFLSTAGTPTALIYNGGNLTDLAPTLLPFNRVWAINNSGLLAGHSWGPGANVSFLNVCGTTIDLGTLPGFTQTSVWAVNNAGQMVGSVSSDVSTLLNAFVYTGGTLYNLNDLVVGAGQWEFLSVAFGVNNSGQITGYGRIGGQFRGFILTPLP